MPEASQKPGSRLFALASDASLDVAHLCDALGEDGKRSRRAAYATEEAGGIIHKVPWYQPGSVAQSTEAFQALGLERG